MARKKRRAGADAGWKLSFWLYLLFLILFVVIKFDGSIQDLLDRIESYRFVRSVEPGYNLNLEPFYTIRSQIRHWPAAWAVRNLVGNVLAFVPFGFLLPRSHRRIQSGFVVMLVALAFICAIEVFQYVTLLGACDVDDVILNLLGCGVGYLLFLLFRGGKER